MKSQLLRSTIGALSMLCFTAVAVAEDTEIPRVQKPNSRAAAKAALMQRYDKNKNGKLDPEEVEAIGRDRMLENDTNKDGKVDQVELKRENPGTRKMPEMDALQRAMARERALTAAREQKEKEQRKAAEASSQDKAK